MDSTDKAVESVLKDEIEKKSKKLGKFGDNMGRVGRRHKGSGKHFDEEAARHDRILFSSRLSNIRIYQYFRGSHFPNMSSTQILLSALPFHSCVFLSLFLC